MYRFLSIGMDVAFTAVAFIPLWIILQMCRRKKADVRTNLLTLLFALSVSAVFSATGMPNLSFHTVDVNLNFLPFADLLSSPMQYILNVALFVPIGFLAPLLWTSFYKPTNAVLLGFGLSLFVELAQLFTHRATDVDDLITNTLGTLFGLLLLRAFTRGRAPGAAGNAPCSKTQWAQCAAVCGAVFVIMFFTQPLLSYLLWSI